MTRMQRLCVAAVVAAGMGGALATPALAQSASGPAFQNTVKGPPPGWKGPVFKLSHDNPATAPSECAECTWLKVDVDFKPQFPPPTANPWDSGNWSEYLKRILAIRVARLLSSEHPLIGLVSMRWAAS
jgi:hypothetical protein